VEAGRQEEKRLLAGRAELAGRLAEVRRDLAEQRERLRRAARVLAALDDASGWWQRWFGDPAQTATNAERRRRMEEMQAETRRRIAVTVASSAILVWPASPVAAPTEGAAVGVPSPMSVTSRVTVELTGFLTVMSIAAAERACASTLMTPSGLGFAALICSTYQQYLPSEVLNVMLPT
jgi:hypothetical protein